MHCRVSVVCSVQRSFLGHFGLPTVSPPVRRKLSCRDVGDMSGRPRLPVPCPEQEEAAGGTDAAVRRQEELLDPRPEGRLRQSGDHQHQR